MFSFYLVVLCTFVGGFLGAYGALTSSPRCTSGAFICFANEGARLVVGWSAGAIFGLFYGAFGIFTIPMTIMAIIVRGN